jgi:hypothetical protein
MQSIFRPASRREVLGEHAGGSRRDGGLKMGWTKRSWCGDGYGYRIAGSILDEDLNRTGSDERVGALRMGRPACGALMVSRDEIDA